MVIKGLVNQLDTLQTTSDSILEETKETEYHFHNIERWFGDIGSPEAGVHEMDNTLTAFQIDSGNNAYGTGICIVGSGDTPVQADKTYFDIHKFMVKSTERTEVYKVRLAWGATESAAITAGNYSTFMFNATATAAGKTEPIDIRMPRLAVGTKVWANCWCANNTGTMDFFFGIHEYDE